jgi:hypothetical protein
MKRIWEAVSVIRCIINDLVSIGISKRAIMKVLEGAQADLLALAQREGSYVD